MNRLELDHQDPMHTCNQKHRAKMAFAYVPSTGRVSLCLELRIISLALALALADAKTDIHSEAHC